MFFCKRSLQATLFLCAIFSQLLWAQNLPNAQQFLENFGISVEQISQLDRGEIVTYEVSETSQKELAVGVAMYMPVQLAQVLEYLKRGNLIIQDSNITASGLIPDNADINTFKKFAFGEKQLDEATAFLKAEAGNKFNLSKQEIEALQSLLPKPDDIDKKILLKTASQKYREILLQHWKDYRKSGLAGISAYSRDGSNADPATELRTDAVNSKTWAHYFPQLQQGWLNYPVGLPKSATEQFFWMNRIVEDRPTAILSHRVIIAGAEGGIILHRQFYVGHSYNSSHVVAGGIPYKDGTLMFYSTHSSTDQVGGVGSSLKHVIGREQMKKLMIKNLLQLNKNLQKKSSK